MLEENKRKIGAILSYITIIATTLIQLIYTPFLIRFLGQNEYGLYSLITSLIGYLTVLDLGFGNAIIVYTTKFRVQGKYEEERKLHGMFFLIFCIISVIAAILGMILYFNVDNMFGNTMTEYELSKAKIMMIILTFNLVFTFIFSIYSSILNAYERFVYQKLISLIGTLARPLIMTPLLFLGYKSIAMATIITITNVFVVVSNYIYCRKKLNIKIKFIGFDKTLFKKILGYSIWLFLTAIVDKINWSVDQFILGVVSGTTSISVYSIASSLNNLFVNLSTAINGVMLPKVTKMVANDSSSQELTDELIKVGRIQFIIIFFAASGLLLFGKDFIIWWAGNEYSTSYYVALCLILPAIFSLIQNLGLNIMQAMNKFKFKSIATFIMAIFNIIISFVLATKWGAVGAALGTTISIIICNIIIMNIYYYKVIKLDVIKFWKNIAKMIIKYMGLITIIFIVFQIKRFDGIINVLIYGTIYTILYCIITYKFVSNDYEKNLISKLFYKLSKRRK